AVFSLMASTPVTEQIMLGCDSDANLPLPGKKAQGRWVRVSFFDRLLSHSESRCGWPCSPAPPCLVHRPYNGCSNCRSTEMSRRVGRAWARPALMGHG